MKTTLLLAAPILFATVSSCALVTVPVKVAGKVVTTTVGLAGKAAGAGIDAMKKDDETPAEEDSE